MVTLILMMGAPGSGKTKYCGTLSDDYMVVHRDDYTTIPKMFKHLGVLLQTLPHKNIVIDATHGTKKQRMESITRASKLTQISDVGIWHIPTSKQQCIIQNQLRDKRVPNIAIYTWFARFEPCDASDLCKTI